MKLETEIRLLRGCEIWLLVPLDNHTFVAAHAASSVWLFLELCDCLCFIRILPCNCSDKIRFDRESYYLRSLFLLKTYCTLSLALVEDTDNQHRM